MSNWKLALNYLGELTNELASPDDYIIEFVSGGPKNYAFRTIQGEQICRIRGFSLNYQIAQILKFSFHVRYCNN